MNRTTTKVNVYQLNPGAFVIFESKICLQERDILSKKRSKKEGKDQESIQSSTTPDTGYQLESDFFIIRHHKRKPRGQS